MQILTVCLGIFLLIFTLDLPDVECNKACYHAKICVHNGNERCGEDKEGKHRRFLDSCDILEYNCLKGTAYVKTNMEKCNNLPPIEEENKKSEHKNKESKQAAGSFKNYKKKT